MSSNRTKIGVVGDIHGNFGALELAINLFEREGIDHQYCTGDILGHYMAEATRDSANFSRKVYDDLHYPKSIYREGMEEGIWTPEQIERVSKPRGLALESLLRHSEESYRIFKRIAPNLRTVPGNHDIEKTMGEILAENLLKDEFIEVEGMNWATTGGGGSAPDTTGGIREPFYCDDQDRGRVHSRKAQKLLLQPRGQTQEENTLDALILHIPPPLKGQHVDSYAIHVRDILLQRYKSGLPMPQLIIHGHHHSSSALIDWQTYKDPASGDHFEALTFSPGVLTQKRVSASYGTFTTAEFDEKNRLAKVDEYRVYNTIAGIRKVVLHGEHTVDHDKKEVDFKTVNKTIFDEADKELFVESLELDKNYALHKKNLCIDYKGLNGVELDNLIKQNLAVSNHLVEIAVDDMKSVLDSVKNDWNTDAKDLGKKFSWGELQTKQREIADLLGDKAASNFGINIDEINCSEFESTFYRRALMRVWYGITFNDIQEATDLKTQKYEDVPVSFGGSLLKKVSETLGNQYQSHFLSPLKAKEWMKAVEVYTPMNVERTRELDDKEGLQLYAKGLNSGLLTEEDVLTSGAYKKTKDFKANKLSLEEIDQKFGITEMRTLEEKKNELSLDEAQNALTQGTRVYNNKNGDYVLTTNGNKKYIPKELRGELNYQTETIKDLLDQGEAELINGGDVYKVRIDGQNKPITIDPETECIDLDKHEATPLWLADQQQQPDISDLLKLFQNGGLQQPSSNVLSPQTQTTSSGPQLVNPPSSGYNN